MSGTPATERSGSSSRTGCPRPVVIAGPIRPTVTRLHKSTDRFAPDAWLDQRRWRAAGPVVATDCDETPALAAISHRAQDFNPQRGVRTKAVHPGRVGNGKAAAGP